MTTIRSLSTQVAALATLLGAAVGSATLAQAADAINGTAAAPSAMIVTPLKAAKTKVFSAVVSDTGVLQRGSAVGASTLGTGSYQIDFSQNVSACTFVASQGTTSTGTQPDGTATTAQRAGVATAVFVKTYDTTGTAADRSFHLTVIC